MHVCHKRCLNLSMDTEVEGENMTNIDTEIDASLQTLMSAGRP